MYYNHHNLAIKAVCSKSDMKPEIAAVLFTPTCTVATDSFRLIEMGVVKPDINSGDGDCLPFLIEAKQLPKTTKKNELVKVEKEKATVKGATYTLQETQGSYPDYTKVIPQGEPVARMRVNAKYLAEVLEIIGALDTTWSGVELEFYGDYKPLKIVGQSADGQRGMGLVMPLTK